MKPWQTKAWREKRKEWLKGKQCNICGIKENLSIHHTKDVSDEDYVNFVGCIALCKRHHFQMEMGYVRCKICKTTMHKPQHNQCIKCAPSTVKKRVQSWRIYKKFTLPCGKIVQDMAIMEMGGDLDLCLHHCSKDFNSCEDLTRALDINGEEYDRQCRDEGSNIDEA